MPPVDSQPHMQPLGAIAARDGVTRQAVSKQVARLVAHHGLETTRDGRGRVALVNVVHYDLLLKRHGDSAKRRSPEQPSPAAAPPFAAPSPLAEASDTLDGARREKVILEAQHLKLTLAERAGQLVRADLMVAALARLSDDLVRAIDSSPHADALLAAAAESPHAFRVALKRMDAARRTAAADAFAAAQIAAPRQDALLETEEAEAA